jgi:hypothetical protein
MILLKKKKKRGKVVDVLVTPLLSVVAYGCVLKKKSIRFWFFLTGYFQSKTNLYYIQPTSFFFLGTPTINKNTPTIKKSKAKERATLGWLVVRYCFVIILCFVVCGKD